MTYVRLALAVLVVTPGALPLACGPSEPPPVTPARGAPSAAATGSSLAASASSASVAAPALPPAAPLPPTPMSVSTVAAAKTEPSWMACDHAGRVRSEDVVKGVTAMAHACEAVTRMKLVGKTLLAKQAAEDPPQSFPFEAKANHCYRAYASGAGDIKDLDLAVKDSAGVIASQDSTDDASPVVPRAGAVCFRADDQASVVVSVGMGKGAYAVQVWGD
jgi:hypothetical protein